MKLFLFIFYLLTFASCRDPTDLAGQLKRINNAYKARNVQMVLAEFDKYAQYYTIAGGRQTRRGLDELKTWLTWLRQNNQRVEFLHLRTKRTTTVSEAEYQLTRFDGQRSYVEYGTIFVPKSTGKINKIIRIQ